MLVRTLLLALTVLLSSMSAQNATEAASARPRHDLVVVTIRDAASLAKLMALDLDLAACHGLELPVREIEVIADAADLVRLKNSGLPYRIEVHDLERTIERRALREQAPLALSPSVGQGGMGGHYTWAEVNSILDEFAKKHPAICTKKVSLGKTHENRDIWMVKISDNVQTDEDEPEVLFDALHHAREPLSMTTTLLFMDWLLENYGKDPDATFLVDHREMYFVPCLNPDGYEYNRSIQPNGGGMWRKNRRNNGSNYGVDLNRNWPTGWTAPYGGSSTSTSSDTYRGTAPLSEPETTALENFILSRNFVVGCSCHCYQDILLYPYGFQNQGPTNEAEYKRIGAFVTGENHLPYGITAQILYIAAGAALDHYHEVHKMYGFTPELGKSSEGGFWPNRALQVDIANRNQRMFRGFAMVAGSALDFEDVTVREGPGSNQNKVVEAGESGVLDLAVQNQGIAATSGKATVTLSTSDPLVTIVRGTLDLGQVAKFGSAQKQDALEFRVAATHRALFTRLRVRLAFDGAMRERELVVPLAPRQLLAAHDFEIDLGFARSAGDTATTGNFERAAPQQTNYQNAVFQPGQDHSPNGTLCWVTDGRAGTSAGQYDVDGGHTSFVSPVLDLSHVTLPELSFWLHFSESQSNDPFLVEVSDDGGKSWEPRYSRQTSTNSWQLVTISGLPSTKLVQLRFWTQDANASLVEACVDDLEIVGIVRPADLTFLGSAARGTALRWNLHGEPGAIGIPLAGVRGSTLQVPGIEGTLELDLATLFTLTPVLFGGSRNVARDLPIPQDTNLIGFRLAAQQLLVSGGKLYLGNLQEAQVK